MGVRGWGLGLGLGFGLGLWLRVVMEDGGSPRAEIWLRRSSVGGDIAHNRYSKQRRLSGTWRGVRS